MALSETKYDMRFNPAYQIDCVSASSGKRVAATKRKAIFRFGFSNREALDNGCKGPQARGEEHEVRLIWSLASGKRAVSFDGNEVHFSMGRRGDSKFETSWPIQGGHILKLVAYATTPLRSGQHFKQFELFLDGMSFFALPRIYELGVRSGTAIARAVNPSAHGFASQGFPYKNSRRTEHGRRPIVYSHHDAAGYEYEQSSYNPTPTLSYSQTPQGYQGYVNEPTVLPETIPPTTKDKAAIVMPAMTVQDVLSEPAEVFNVAEQRLKPGIPIVDEFTPVQQQSPPPPTYQDVSSKILSIYDPPDSTNSSVEALVPHRPFCDVPAQQPETYLSQPAMVSPAAGSYNGYFHHQEPSTPPQLHVPNHAFNAPVVTPTMTMMTPLEVDELRDNPPPVDAMDQAVQSLVNLEDLTLSNTTPEQLKAKKRNDQKKKLAAKSQPKAPAATDWLVGNGASLADIKQNKKPAASIAKEIMKVHASDPAAAQAGMMVVYGQQPFPGGPVTSVGFGVGSGVYHQGLPQTFRSNYY